jgi:hypothetical protein
MSTRKERRAVLMAVLKAALKTAPPGVDRKFVLAAVKPAINSLLDAAEQRERDERVREKAEAADDLFHKPFRENKTFGYEVNQGWVLYPGVTPIAGTFELQDFLLSLRHGYSRERMEAAEKDRQHRLAAGDFNSNGKFERKWEGFAGSAYLSTGMQWFVLLLRSHKWALARMLLLWLCQINLEAKNFPKQVRDFWRSKYAREWEEALHSSKASLSLAAEDEGSNYEPHLINSLRQTYNLNSGKIYETLQFVRDRYGQNWLLMEEVRRDLHLSLMDAQAWDGAITKLAPSTKGLDPATDPRLSELRLIVGTGALQPPKVPRDSRSFPSLRYALRLHHRDLLEAFRADHTNLTHHSAVHVSLELDQLDWIDGLDELELFEAAEGERAFPALGLPSMSLRTRTLSEQQQAANAKGAKRKANGANFGATGIVVGALLGAVGFAAWRNRVA